MYRRKFTKLNRGTSLIESMIAVAIIAIAITFAAKTYSTATSSLSRLDRDSDLVLLNSFLQEHISCSAVLYKPDGTTVDPSSTTYCNSNASQTSSNNWIRLTRKTTDGTLKFLTGPLEGDGSAKLGDWHVRASCSAANQTLIVRYARKSSGSQFVKDRQTGEVYDWANPKGIVFGGNNGKSLCYSNTSAMNKIRRAKIALVRKGGSTFQYRHEPIDGGDLAPFTFENTGAEGDSKKSSIGCDAAAGWSLIGCSVTSHNCTVNPPSPKESMFTDQDVSMIDDKCVSNDLEGYKRHAIEWIPDYFPSHPCTPTGSTSNPLYVSEMFATCLGTE